MNRFLLPVSVVGTVIGGTVLLKDYVAGGACPSKATIPGKTVIKCEAAAKDIRGETLNPRVRAQHLDLASLKSIREFARKIIKEEERVDILVNNAAVMRCPHWTTEDGFEMQFGVNYLGHFLLTNLLLEKLKASAPSRIINLSSLAHVAGHIDFDDLNWKTKKYDTKAAYCQSKLAVVLFTKELSRRLQGPFFWLLFKSPQLAAQPSTYLAVAEELESVSGKYFDGLREKAPSPEAEDEEVARRLWAESAHLVGLDMAHGSPGRGRSLPR
ncbi:hypothetical protein A6R68_17171 [Neotoma lepida]|uniref:Retinol dehydrogenase 13 n=1 Tax=Neotoma lepida TaxID=56216 RepID=A0A1A6HCT6_NEOLE|nr:hypothetical protein A6R68_17171 [Neotoma lepida]